MSAAQVLLTHADLADRERYLNARTTLLTLLEHGVVPGDQRERYRRQRRDQVLGTTTRSARWSPTWSMPTRS